MNHSSSDQVACADRIIALHKHRMLAKTIAAFLTVSPFLIAGGMMDLSWLGGVGVFLAAIGIVVPHVLRIHRALGSIPCPACGHEVGNYTTSKSRVILHCRKCGHDTPTDCYFFASGAPPTKI